MSIAGQVHSGQVARTVRIASTCTKQTKATVGTVIQPLMVLVVLTALLENIFTAREENVFIVGRLESEVVVHTVPTESTIDLDNGNHLCRYIGYKAVMRWKIMGT